MKQSSNFDLDVIVHGSESRKYFHDGKFYVEGKEESEFKIKLRNNTNKRVLAVLTIDGLSAIDGKEGSFDSNGYILNARDSITIPGWRLNNDEVAKFEFTGGENSYASKKGKGKNIGVIGCAFYYEKEFVWPTYYICDHGKHCGCSRNDLGRWWNEPNFTFTGSSSSGTFKSYDGNRGGTVAMQNLNVGDSVQASSMQASNQINAFSAASTPTNQSLGTGFGEKRGHRVTNSFFDRATDIPAEILTVYYDSRGGLKRRGINLEATMEIASPFPRENYTPGYCEPPTNWRG